MKRLLPVIAPLLLQSNAWALSLIPITDAMRIEGAERIVIGTATQKGSDWVIQVEEVLKGPAQPVVIRTKWNPQDSTSSKVLFVEAETRSRLTHFSHIEEGSPQWDLYHMLVDPKPLLDLEKHPESPEINQVLGYLFDPVKVTSANAPEVAEELELWRDAFPWDFQGMVEMKCRADPERNSRLEILSMEPDDASSQKFRVTVITGGMAESMRSSLPEAFTVRIDTRPVASRGSLDLASATGYLRESLESNIPQVQVSAIRALQRIRDLNAVPSVIRLIDHEDESVARTALGFLATAKDMRSLDPLCRLLETTAPLHPEKIWLSSGAAEALGKIGDPQAIPFLESAAKHRVGYAFYSLGRCGRKESIGAILETANAEGLPNGAGVSLFWLVKRSNIPTETWMEMDKMRGVGMSPGLVRKWKSWWAKNEKDLTFVRSAEAANIAWNPPAYKPPQRYARHFQHYWWKYSLGLAMLVGALVAVRKCLASSVVRVP